MLKINDSKFAIFTDIHFGDNSDNEQKLIHNSNCIDWIIEECVKNKVGTAIFAGDFFDNDKHISLLTEDYAYNNIKKFSKQLGMINLIMIVGNHDIYYKNSDNVNSLKKYESLEHVTIIRDYTEANIVDSGKTVLLCPWKNDLETSFNVTKKYDYAIGHFSLKDAQLAGTVSKNGLEMAKLTDVAPLVFSGHYHINKEYNQKNGKIITVGCPLQLDMGDCGNQKGFYIVDSNEETYKFIENKTSPIYLKLYWSKIKNKITDGFDKISGNYVKLIIDDEYKYEQVQKLVSVVNNKNPLALETDYLYSTNFQKDFMKTQEVNVGEVKTNNQHAIDIIESEDKDKLKDLDLEKLKTMISKYLNVK